ncbi:MMPL family transporter [Streptomyces sp. DH12]|uniref:MMPL family transporter n=1 Tax=Streptomyces sp. DH12 TaxID=2857010 RepID=UPI001E40663F|nr:MMPL family transporter [Streptomyces sp. DH12]
MSTEQPPEASSADPRTRGRARRRDRRPAHAAASTGLLEGIAHHSVRRPLLTLAASVLAVLTLVCGVIVWSPQPMSTGGYDASGTESARAESELTGQPGRASPGLLLHARADGPIDSPQARADGLALTRRVTGETGVVRADAYWTTGAATLRSRDGRAALVTVRLAGDEAEQTRTAARLVPRLTGQRGSLEVTAAGWAWARGQGAEQGARDLAVAEAVVAPVTLVILVVAFGSALAAMFPLLIGGLTVAGTWATLHLLNQVMEVSAYSLNIATALGFGFAVDYALLIVTRYREERGRGLPGPAAVVAAAGTAGRSVTVSAGVVVLAFCAVWVMPFPWLRSMALAGVAVVVLSALCSVVVLPALLALFGGRLRHRAATTSPGWRRIALWATRRPWVAGVGCAVLLAGLVWPVTHARWGFADERSLPAHSEVRRTAETIRTGFPTEPDRELLVVFAGAPGTGAVDRYARSVAALPGVTHVTAPTGRYEDGERLPPPTGAHTGTGTDTGAGAGTGDTGAGGAPVSLTVSTRYAGQSQAAEDLVHRVRGLPAPGEHWVGGTPARHVDAKDALKRRAPLAGLLIAVTTFLLLFRYTRSVLIPLKTLALAALSLSACLGAMVYVFQDGHLRWLVGDFTATGWLDMTVPPLLCAVAFALTIDYEVFLLARIKEHYTAHGDHVAAVVAGIARTGRLVSVAALVFAVAMAGLATSGVVTLKIIGVGLALAVLVDATLIRGVLVPAFMRLTGDANWWAPAFARRRAPVRHPARQEDHDMAGP